MNLKSHVSSKPRLIYLLSPSFSGSTLLTLLLAQHPRIATIGELKATAMGSIENYYCSCGQPIKVCEFWEDLRILLKKQGVPFSLDNFGTHFSAQNKIWKKILNAQARSPLFETMRKHIITKTPGLKSHYETILETNRLFIQSSCELQQSDIFLDGSKDPHRLLYLLQSNLWDIHVIRIHRNGVAQSNSHRRKFGSRATYKNAVKEWKKTIKHMDHVSKLVRSERLLTLKYEDLCKDPNNTMQKCWKFLDIEEMEMDWRNVDLKHSPHHILGNQMRTRNSIQIKLDEKWADEISDTEYKLFNNIAGRTNNRLGYTETGK